MIDLHGFETRRSCFGETASECTYDPDFVDDPTAEEMEDLFGGVEHHAFPETRHE